MERYDYREALRQDILTYIEEQGINLRDVYETQEEAYEDIYDRCWISDSVTGNASGSYWCNRWQAEECICHNLDLLGDAVAEFGGATDVLKDGAETCDVTIRCYLLGEILGEVIENLWNA